jgi:hypothetical protein
MNGNRRSIVRNVPYQSTFIKVINLSDHQQFSLSRYVIIMKRDCHL